MEHCTCEQTGPWIWTTNENCPMHGEEKLMSETPVNITYNIENYFEQSKKPKVDSKQLSKLEWEKLLCQVASDIYYALNGTDRKADETDVRVYMQDGVERTDEYELWEDYVVEAHAALKSLGYISDPSYTHGRVDRCVGSLHLDVGEQCDTCGGIVYGS